MDMLDVVHEGRRQGKVWLRKNNVSPQLLGNSGRRRDHPSSWMVPGSLALVWLS